MIVLIRLLVVHFVVMDFCSFVTGLFVWARGASSVLVWGHEVDSWSLVGAEARGWGLRRVSSGKAGSSVLVWGDEVDSWLIR